MVFGRQVVVVIVWYLVGSRDRMVFGRQSWS
jgi:hypothetical protein